MLNPPATYVVSACLSGEACRYNGLAFPVRMVQELVQNGDAVPVCPEVLGGLSVPRSPCEKSEESVLTQEGRDCTAEFRAGAEAALQIAHARGCRAAILKARSPSCGVGEIYDGTFSHCRVNGDGVFAELLRQQGFTLHTEESLPDTLAFAATND